MNGYKSLMLVLMCLVFSSLCIGASLDYADLSLTELTTLAGLGDAAAQCKLGLAYYQGKGVAIDPQQALNWFSLASDQGNAIAIYHLGIIYDQGKGVSIDYAKAAAYYEIAANMGLAQAQFQIGLMYAKGQGVTQNDELAYYWSLLACSIANTTQFEEYAKFRDLALGKLNPEQKSKIQEDVKAWKPKPVPKKTPNSIEKQQKTQEQIDAEIRSLI